MAHVTADMTGTVTGRTITLDRVVPALEGRCVHILIEPIAEEVRLSKAQQQEAWEQWAQRDDDGPIADDAEPEIP